MNQDFFEALELLEAEKGIPVDSILDNIKNAINVAVRKYYTVGEDNVVIDINQAENKFKVSIVKDIVEEVEDEGTQISLEEALEKTSALSWAESLPRSWIPNRSAGSRRSPGKT